MHNLDHINLPEHTRLSSDDWKNLHDMEILLRPFKRANKHLESDKVVTNCSSYQERKSSSFGLASQDGDGGDGGQVGSSTLEGAAGGSESCGGARSWKEPHLHRCGQRSVRHGLVYLLLLPILYWLRIELESVLSNPPTTEGLRRCVKKALKQFKKSGETRITSGSARAHAVNHAASRRANLWQRPSLRVSLDAWIRF